MNNDQATLEQATANLNNAAATALTTLTDMLAHPIEEVRMKAASIILNYYIQFTNPFLDPIA